MKGLKKDDTVFVVAGKDKGKSGKVLRVLPKSDKIVVEGVNVYKRHRRPKKSGEKGSVIQMPKPMQRSNTMLKCPKCKKATRRAFKILTNGSKVRVCKKCQADI